MPPVVLDAERDDPGRDTFHLVHVVTLAGAHFIHDVYTAFLAPLLPLLISKLGLSLALAGSLSVFTQLPSLLNPLIGVAVDRAGISRWLVIVSPSVTAAGMCLIGVAPSYGALVICLLTAGVSVAAIHLAAPVLVAEVSGDRLGRGTSFFMVGGELARTVGPLVAVQAVASFGIEGLWRLIPVGVAASLILWWRLGRVQVAGRTRPRAAGIWTTWRRMRRIMIGVQGVLMARAFMASALTAFLPTLLYGEGESLWIANIGLVVFELAGAAGAMTAGTASDWLGRRRVLLVAVCLSPGLLGLFLLTEGPAMFLVLVALGFVTLSTTPVLMAVMLESSEGDRATASGTFIMMSFAIRSLVIPLVGALGDVLGLRTAFAVCAVVAVLGVPFVYLIPQARERVTTAS